MLRLSGLKARVAVFLLLLDPSITVALTSLYKTSEVFVEIYSVLETCHTTLDFRFEMNRMINVLDRNAPFSLDFNKNDEIITHQNQKPPVIIIYINL